MWRRRSPLQYSSFYSLPFMTHWLTLFPSAQQSTGQQALHNNKQRVEKSTIKFAWVWLFDCMIAWKVRGEIRGCHNTNMRREDSGTSYRLWSQQFCADTSPHQRVLFSCAFLVLPLKWCIRLLQSFLLWWGTTSVCWQGRLQCKKVHRRSVWNCAINVLLTIRIGLYVP